MGVPELHIGGFRCGMVIIFVFLIRCSIVQLSQRCRGGVQLFLQRGNFRLQFDFRRNGGQIGRRFVPIVHGQSDHDIDMSRERREVGTDVRNAITRSILRSF